VVSLAFAAISTVNTLLATQPISSSLAGQTAVITGASGGIGGSIALELARSGADVLLLGTPDGVKTMRRAG
jgi:FlaA1/EpsC-like NDP-sugar epimerase